MFLCVAQEPNSTQQSVKVKTKINILSENEDHFLIAVLLIMKLQLLTSSNKY
jgi:hypothetical protein